MFLDQWLFSSAGSHYASAGLGGRTMAQGVPAPWLANAFESSFFSVVSNGGIFAAPATEPSYEAVDLALLGCSFGGADSMRL